MRKLLSLLTAILFAGSVLGAEGDQLYSGSFSSVSAHSYTQNKTFTLNSKSFKSSVSQVNSSVFYLGVNSNNSAKGVLNNNSDFSSVVATLRAENATYNTGYETAHAYALLLNDGFNTVGNIKYSWSGANGAGTAYIFADSGSGWTKIASKSVSNGTSTSGNIEYSNTAEGGLDFNSLVFVFLPSANDKNIRLTTLVIKEGKAANPTTCATPTFSPEAGAVVSGTEVTISSVTEGATIYYTTDGNDPATSSSTTQPIVITAATTIKAIAVKDGLSNSAVASASYTLACATPTFTPEAGTYSSDQNVSISCATTGATIYYTTDGSDPTTESDVYSSAILVNTSTTIKAIAVKEGFSNSSIASASFKIQSDAIELSAGQTLTFESFSNAGGYDDYVSENVKIVYFDASDGIGYKFTGLNYGNFQNNGERLQIRNTPGYIITSPITAPEGFRMILSVYTATVNVYVGDVKQTPVSGNTYEFEKSNSATSIKIERATATPQITSITFYALKPSRTITFEDGDQEMTYGGATITKVATVSPTGTPTYSSSDETIATVDENTGEVTAVKAGTVTITATVAADDDYEESKGSYTVTVNKAASTLAFAAAEQTVELVDGSATYTATLTPIDGRSVTYSSDDITVNSSTGAVTYTATGDYVIKATAVASDKYLAPAEASYTLHVIDSREPVVSNVNLLLKDDGDNVIALDEVVKENTGTLSATYTKAAGFTGDAVVSFASSNADVFYVSGTDFAALKGGEVTVTVTITSGGNNLYTDVVKAFTVTITNPSKSDNELAVMDDETNVYEDGDALNLTYGTSFDLDVSASTGYDGTIGAVFANNEIAEVNVLGSTYTINPLAVGSTTLTLSAPATANFKAAANIVLTINVASVDAKTTSGTTEGVVEDLDFSKYYVPNTWEMTTTNTDDYQAWTDNQTNDFISANGYSNPNRYEGTYDYITDEYDLTRYTSAAVIFEHAGRYFNSAISDGVKLFAEVNGVKQELTINTYFAGTSLNSYVKNTTDITSLCGKKVKIIFRYISDGTSTNTGRWDIKSFKISGTTYTSESVTLNASGLATYCSQYPLDFSDYATAGYKAYQITSVSGTEVTCTQITGQIKGGQGVLLKGEASAEITINNAASSDAVLGSNKLVGCINPTYLAASTQDYVLNGDEFELVNSAETIGANKAYLHFAEPLGTSANLTLKLDDTPTDFEDVETSVQAVKVLRNGQLFIEKAGKVYTITGQLVK